MRKYYRHIKNHRPSHGAVLLILIWIGISLTADFLANEKPIFIQVEGVRSWPIFSAYGHWIRGEEYAFDVRQIKKAQRLLLTPIPYSDHSIDLRNANFKSPFSQQDISSWKYRHWLGTDQIGRDVLAGLIHGARVAAVVGICTMAIAGLLGLFFGLIAGYFGNYQIRISPGGLFFLVFLMFLVIYCSVQVFIHFKAMDTRLHLGWCAFFLFGVMTAVVWFIIYIQKRFPVRRSVGLPLDLSVLKSIEMLRSIPRLFILLALLPLFQESSLINIFVLLGLISWPGIALLMRSEVIKIRSLPYIHSSRILGVPSWRIMLRHILPNCLGPFWVVISFGVAGAIIAEATLSFLGIGIPIDQVSWGSMLNEARGHFSAWWLALFPGIALFLIIFSFNILGDRLRELPLSQ